MPAGRKNTSFSYTPLNVNLLIIRTDLTSITQRLAKTTTAARVTSVLLIFHSKHLQAFILQRCVLCSAFSLHLWSMYHFKE